MNGNKYKILIIEDDEHINNLVATLLEANGYQTLSAYSCEDGMMMYASHRPDLVVLDLGLPDQDGMTFLKRLRKDSLTPVIVLSARSDEKDKVEALDMGANDYINKFRMEKAITLMTGTELSFTEIAEKVGFTTSRYFSTAFKQYTGETPTQYKEKRKQEKKNE